MTEELFSYRYGYKKPREKLQIESMDEGLRNGLWNLLDDYYWSDNTAVYLESDTHLSYLVRKIWDVYFRKRKDDIPRHSWALVRELISDYFFGCEWNEVFDFIQFVSNNYANNLVSEEFMEECNLVLKREMSSYRFVGRRILQITNEEEIAEIEEALQVTKPTGIAIHLNDALNKLSDRETPDYRNSIKESISAVETMCCAITGNPKTTLGKALGAIRREGEVEIHPILNEAFDKLYGYTSDEDGVRHKIMEDPNLDFEDAKFMFVTCSAFINYLKIKASKADINLVG